jgi:hypothetical protein
MKSYEPKRIVINTKNPVTYHFFFADCDDLTDEQIRGSLFYGVAIIDIERHKSFLKLAVSGSQNIVLDCCWPLWVDEP